MVKMNDMKEAKMMICPKAETCGMKQYAPTAHCKKHKKKDFCDAAANGCPACVPVEKKRKKTRYEARGALVYYVYDTKTGHMLDIELEETAQLIAKALNQMESK